MSRKEDATYNNTESALGTPLGLGVVIIRLHRRGPCHFQSAFIPISSTCVAIERSFADVVPAMVPEIMDSGCIDNYRL